MMMNNRKYLLCLFISLVAVGPALAVEPCAMTENDAQIKPNQVIFNVTVKPGERCVLIDLMNRPDWLKGVEEAGMIKEAVIGRTYTQYEFSDEAKKVQKFFRIIYASAKDGTNDEVIFGNSRQAKFIITYNKADSAN